MRSKKYLAAILISGLLLIMSIPSYSQEDQASRDAVELTHKFSRGSVNHYRVSQKLKGTRQFSESSAPVAIDAEVSSIIRLRCVRLLTDGSAELSVETLESTLKVAGRESAVSQSPDGARVLRMAPDGRVIQPKVDLGETRQGTSPLDLSSVESIMFMVVLPDKPVTTGDEWTADIPLSFDRSAKINLASKLNQVHTDGESRIAEITQALTTPINVDSDTESGSLSGSQEGKTTLRFDTDRGLLLSIKGEIQSAIVSTASAPAMPGQDIAQQGTVTSTLKLNSSFTIEFLEDMQASD